MSEQNLQMCIHVHTVNYLETGQPHVGSSTLSPGSYVHLDQTTLPSVLRRVQIVQFNTTGRVVQGVESQETVAC